MRRNHLLLPALASLLAAFVLTGCGSSSHGSGTEADPASAVPASAPLFVEATVRPQGTLSSGALAAGRELTGQADPYLRLLGLLGAAGTPTPDFKREVAPWLGAHAGMFVSSLASAGPLVAVVQQALGSGGGAVAGAPFGSGRLEGAIVLDTTDASRARAFLAAQARKAGARPASYRGVSYEATSGGLAFGLVRRFAVIGSEAGLRSVVDTTQGGAALTAASGYAKLASAAPAGSIAHLYANPQSPTAAAARSAEAQGVLALLGGRAQTDISALLSEGSLALDIDTLGAGGGLLSPDPQAAAALSRLPSESWLALGIGHAGQTLAGDVTALQAFGPLLGGSGESSSLLSIPSLVDALTTPLKILAGSSPEARRDFSSWMGAAGIFAAGSSLFELKAAVVIESSDAARSKAAVAKLGAALRAQHAGVASVRLPGTEAAISARVSGLPLPLEIGAGTGSDGHPRFVLALGEQSVAAALSPPATLGGSAPATAAAQALGEGAQPSLMLDTPTLVSLLEAVGVTEGHAGGEFLPILRAASTVAGGGHALSSEIQRYRLVVALRHGASG